MKKRYNLNNRHMLEFKKNEIGLFMKDEEKFQVLLAHYGLEKYYGDFLTIGVFTLEEFAKVTNEDLSKIDIPENSSDFKKLSQLITTISNRNNIDKPIVKEKPHTLDKKEENPSNNETSKNKGDSLTQSIQEERQTQDEEIESEININPSLDNDGCVHYDTCINGRSFYFAAIVSYWGLIGAIIYTIYELFSRIDYLEKPLILYYCVAIVLLVFTKFGLYQFKKSAFVTLITNMLLGIVVNSWMLIRIIISGNIPTIISSVVLSAISLLMEIPVLIYFLNRSFAYTN